MKITFLEEVDAFRLVLLDQYSKEVEADFKKARHQNVPVGVQSFECWLEMKFRKAVKLDKAEVETGAAPGVMPDCPPDEKYVVYFNASTHNRSGFLKDDKESDLISFPHYIEDASEYYSIEEAERAAKGFQRKIAKILKKRVYRIENRFRFFILRKTGYQSRKVM